MRVITSVLQICMHQLRCRVWIMLFVIDLKCSRWFSKILMLLPMLPTILTSIAVS